MDGEQDIRKMGGLRKKMPLTYFTFLAATLAISGIPPFSGFFSKDMILNKAFEHSIIVYVLALAGALLTCFYMFRLLYLVFFSEQRLADAQWLCWGFLDGICRYKKYNPKFSGTRQQPPVGIHAS